MAVAKRQGREKPAKIEQKKVRGMRTSGKTNDTPGCPISIGQAQGEINIEIEEPKPALSLSLSPPHPARWGALLLSLDRRALRPQRWVFLLSSK